MNQNSSALKIWIRGRIRARLQSRRKTLTPRRMGSADPSFSGPRLFRRVKRKTADRKTGGPRYLLPREWERGRRKGKWARGMAEGHALIHRPFHALRASQSNMTTPRNGTQRAFSGGLLLAVAGIFALSLLIVDCNPTTSKVSAAAGPAMNTKPTIETVKVIARKLDMTIPLPGELEPYEQVRIFPKVTGFVQWIGVDRGSRVKKGQLLAVLIAPEIVAQKVGAQAKLLSAENQRIAAEAKLAADESTYQRLKVAAATPGVISDNELEVAEKTAEADRARVVALRNTRDAAQATLRAVEETESYLRITAPFDGVITKRNVHPGALVGPSGGPGSQSSMVRIEEVSHLRLVVAVPEAYVAGVEEGVKVRFTVPAFPGRTFTGTVARLAESMDVNTRTMPVEMDVWNPGWELHSGMFPEVMWPVRRPRPTLFVPQSSVGRNMEETYVVRIREGKTEWVSVKTGATSGSLTEVFGDLHQGDEVAERASDDLRPGTSVTTHANIF